MSRKRKTPTQYHPPTDVDGRLMPDDEWNLADQRWWRAKDEDVHKLLMTRVRMLRQRQRSRREMYRFYAELFGTQEIAGLGLTNYDPQHTAFIAPSLPYNVVRRGVKTVLAKITKHKPVPMVVAERGNYTQTKRARGLTNFLNGLFTSRKLKVFPRMREAARDALVFGTGILKISHNAGDSMPRIDRILPWEMLVDTADARYGEPKQLFFVRWVDRAVLKEIYPEHAKEIEKATSSSGTIDDQPDYVQQGDMVLVTEAYRLPVNDGKRKVKGRFAIAIDNVTLDVGEWTRSEFPVVFIKYDEPLIGFFGEGLAAEMAGFQYEVNYVTETLRMAHRVQGTGIWMVPDGGDIPDGHFENGVGFLLKHKPGFKPEYVSPDPANPQTYEYQDRCANGALEWSGISSLSAKGEKPAGITAAKAIQTVQDVEDDGLSVFEDAYEELAIDVADHLITEFKELSEENPDLSIFAQQRRTLLQVKWADVDMDRDAIQLQVWSTNLLGRTPAARMQMVSDLYNGGVIDKARYLKLLDAPDIDEETDLMGALQECADQQIEAILDIKPGAQNIMRAAYAPLRPEPYQDLLYAMWRAQQWVCMAKLCKVPRQNIDLLRLYIEDCKAEMDKRNPPAPPTQLAPAPIANPGAPQPGPAPMPPGAAPMMGAPPGAAPPPAPPMAA